MLKRSMRQSAFDRPRSWVVTVSPCSGVDFEHYWTTSPHHSHYQLFVYQQILPLSGAKLLTQHIGFSTPFRCFPVVNTKVKSFCDPNGKDLEDYRRHQRMVQVRQDVDSSVGACLVACPVESFGSIILVVHVLLQIERSYMPNEYCRYKCWGCMVIVV